MQLQNDHNECVQCDRKEHDLSCQQNEMKQKQNSWKMFWNRDSFKSVCWGSQAT